MWYFGEIAKNFEDGLLDNLDGSWRTCKDGAKPGVLMPAKPERGMIYRHKLLHNEAEDVAMVLSLNNTVSVPAGSFRGRLETLDYTPLEPGVRERKYYAPGIGVILEIDAEGQRTELVKIIDS